MSFPPEQVYVAGKKIAEKGKLIQEISVGEPTLPDYPPVPQVTPEMFRVDDAGSNRTW